MKNLPAGILIIFSLRPLRVLAIVQIVFSTINSLNALSSSATVQLQLLVPKHYTAVQAASAANYYILLLLIVCCLLVNDWLSTQRNSDWCTCMWCRCSHYDMFVLMWCILIIFYWNHIMFTGHGFALLALKIKLCIMSFSPGNYCNSAVLKSYGIRLNLKLEIWI